MLFKNFCIAFLMFFSVSVCATNTWIVEDIKFQGLQNFSQQEALKNVVFTVGNKISKYDIKNSIKILFKTGKFEDIKVIYSRNTIIFNVRERPIISNVVFLGNNIINDSILKKYLIKLNIKEGSPFDSFLVNMFIKTIEDFYYDLGRYKINVKFLKVFSKHNTVNLKILIDEGVSAKINSIKIFGNKDFVEKKIISLFKSKDHCSWLNFLDKCIYSPKELNKDLDRLSNFYLNQGYFYFTIKDKKVHFLKNKDNVNIIINISEGQRYRISRFFVNGDMLPYKTLITDIININSNELYNKEKINFIVNRIKRLLSENGYIHANIRVNPEINHKNKKIVLNFNIDLKQRFFVNRIYFKGNKLTQDKVLRREMKQKEGEYFNIKLVESGQELLQKTKYFSDIKIIPNIRSNHSNQVDIIYEVKEQPTGSINFGLGYGMDSGISFNTSFSQDNIFGSGNSLKVTLIKNDNQKYADISMSYPYFILNSTDLNTRFFYNDFKYNLNNVSNVSKNTFGFESNLGFLINDANRVNFGLGYTHNGVINTEEKQNTKFLLNKQLDTIFLKDSLVNDFTLNYSWTYNSLKNLYFPVSGNQTYIHGKNTIPGSDNNFYKMILDSEEYIPLSKEKKFIFFSHIHMGIGNSLNEEKLPFYENFYATNLNNIRGFRLNTIGPKKIYNSSDLKKCIGRKNNNICESIDSIGGNATAIANLELITPIPFIDNKYSKFLRSSIFLDVGNIWNTNTNNTEKNNPLKFFNNSFFNDIYASTGFSLKCFSPIGPLVFSYSFPIQENKNHQLETFQFNFGKNW